MSHPRFRDLDRPTREQVRRIVVSVAPELDRVRDELAHKLRRSTLDQAGQLLRVVKPPLQFRVHFSAFPGRLALSFRNSRRADSIRASRAGQRG